MKKTYRLTIELGGNHDFDTDEISMDQQHLLDGFIKQLKDESRQRGSATLIVRNIEEAGMKVMEDEVEELESQKSERLALLKQTKSKKVKNNILGDIRELENRIAKLKSGEGKEEGKVEE